MLLWLVVLLVSAAALAAVVMPERILGQVPGLAPYLEWLGLAQVGQAAPLGTNGVPVAALIGRHP
jgi:hypothetical protein